MVASVLIPSMLSHACVKMAGMATTVDKVKIGYFLVPIPSPTPPIPPLPSLSSLLLLFDTFNTF